MDFELRQRLAKGPQATFNLLTNAKFEAEMDARLKLDKTVIQDSNGQMGRVRIWRVVEQIEKPAFARKLIGPTFEYTLEHRTDPSRFRTTWKVTPSVGADRVVAEGYEVFQATYESEQCLRVVFGRVEVDAPVFGRKLAEFIGTEVRRGYERSLDFVEKYVRDH